jgi:hypothetical protein
MKYCKQNYSFVHFNLYVFKHQTKIQEKAALLSRHDLVKYIFGE